MALPLAGLAWFAAMAAVAALDLPAWLLPLVLLSLARWSAALAILAVVALAGGWRLETADYGALPAAVALVGQDVTVEGDVVSEPDPGERSTGFDVALDRVFSPAGALPTAGKVRLTDHQYSDLLPGDRVRLSGELAEPPVFPGFDYRGFLARCGVVGLMRFPQVELLERGEVSFARQTAKARLALDRRLQQALPEPEASLAAGIAFGRDGTLPDDLYDDFRDSGLAHLVAVSGSNVSLVTQLAFLLTIPLLGRRRAILPALLLGAAYLVAAGFSPSVVRAGVMAAILLAGLWLGRPQSGLPALALAGMLMTALDLQTALETRPAPPRILRTDQDGAILIRTNGHTLRISTQR